MEFLSEQERYVNGVIPRELGTIAVEETVEEPKELEEDE
jgi:hypothetical protein